MDRTVYFTVYKSAQQSPSSKPDDRTRDLRSSFL